MILEPQKLKICQEPVTLRSAEEEDAEELITYLKTVSAETPFLIREPEEVTLTLEQERQFIRNAQQSQRELILLAFVQGEHAGNCSVSALGSYSRYAHRCSMAIALYRKYQNRGIGTAMMETALQTAKQMGYEQAELEVAASNQGALHLYEKLGFQTYGTFPDNMKYKDGTYEDSCWMMKKIV